MTKRDREERRQIFWIVSSIFALLLIPAVIGKMTGWRWQPWPPGPHGYGSILGETKRVATNVAPFAFAGL